MFLWAIEDRWERISPAATAMLRRGVELYLSHASIWEFVIKSATGKLRLPAPPTAYLTRQAGLNQLRMLPIRLEHIAALEQLPLLHRDPFDRLLVAQTMSEDLTLITADHALARYRVPVLW